MNRNFGRRKLVVAVTGASGSIYTKVLFEKLQQIKDQIESTAVVMSDNAKDVWKYELSNDHYLNYDFQYFEKHDFFAPFASGSAGYDTMIVCPCSMGTLGRIAHGVSDDLVTRAADVMLKERRQLILVARETPFNLIHLKNMQTIVEAGGIICPANPSFYSLPKNFDDLAATVVDRVLQLAGLSIETYRWGESKEAETK